VCACTIRGAIARVCNNALCGCEVLFGVTRLPDSKQAAVGDRESVLKTAAAGHAIWRITPYDTYRGRVTLSSCFA
jgi:hypothetical protein